ncbi:hypothetical protein [Bradyrhizobium sp. DASA03120]|uniref:hypothetical protein n=1 Tax=Bradyrhizobium sp. SMVTL-02 TaxID=3395917 RepID=UPI003F6F5270
MKSSSFASEIPAPSERRAMSNRTLLGLVVILAPALAFAAYQYLPSPGPLLTPDGITYLDFATERPVGYPIFLFAVKALFGSLSSIKEIQLFIYCLSAGFLAFGCYSISRSMLVALLVELAMFGYPAPVLLSKVIGADSLSASLTTLFTALVLLTAVRKSLASFLLLATIAGTALSVKPVNIALVPAALVMIAAVGKDLHPPRWVQASIVVGTTACGFAITPVIHSVLYGDRHSQSVLAEDLFQKVMFNPAFVKNTNGSCDESFINSILEPVNEYIDVAPSSLKPILKFEYSNYLRYRVLVPGIASRNRYASGSESRRSFWCYIVARFTGAPIAFTRNIMDQAAQEYWKLISNWQFITAQQRTNYEQYVTQNPLPIPAAVAPPKADLEMLHRARNALNEQDGWTSETASPDLASVAPPPARSQLLSVPLKVFQVFSVIASLIAIASLGLHLLRLIKLDLVWLSLGVIGVALQGVLIITSTVEFAQARFVCGVWGLVCATAILSGAEIAKRLTHSGRAYPGLERRLQR